MECSCYSNLTYHRSVILHFLLLSDTDMSTRRYLSIKISYFFQPSRSDFLNMYLTRFWLPTNESCQENLVCVWSLICILAHKSTRCYCKVESCCYVLNKPFWKWSGHAFKSWSIVWVYWKHCQSTHFCVVAQQNSCRMNSNVPPENEFSVETHSL